MSGVCEINNFVPRKESKYEDFGMFCVWEILGMGFCLFFMEFLLYMYTKTLTIIISEDSDVM